MEDVTILPIHLLNEDERGFTYEFSTKKTGDFIFLTRKANSESGNTYHEGKNLGTHPKILILLQGKIQFSYRQIGSTQASFIEIDKPSIIQIQPYVTHAVKALTDICILEANSIADLQDDRIRENVILESLAKNGFVGSADPRREGIAIGD